MSELPHTDATAELLKAGRRAEARKRHNARVKSELARAEAGETINLSDLMGAKEELHIDELDDRR